MRSITKREGGGVVPSPDGRQYLISQKDSKGIYQIYVGQRGFGQTPTCITCVERFGGPKVGRHKMMTGWHPSSRWIFLGIERDKYNRPPIVPDQIIEGWLQSGVWLDMWAADPTGRQWYRLTDFGGTMRAEGYTGPGFTPDGKRAVWAQLVGGNLVTDFFGVWQLVIADFREDRRIPSFAQIRDITPPGARWVEPGDFAPDGRSLLLTADVGLKDPQGMDQFVLDIQTGRLRNLTNSPGIWDEHGFFSPDGKKVFFMSSWPYKDEPQSHKTLSLKTEFMLMNADGSGLQQVTYFNVPGYPESNTRPGATRGQWSVAAIGVWAPDGRSISALNLFFPEYDAWDILFDGPCGRR